MPRHRTPIERAVGRLISAIQKEWVTETGEPAAIAEHVMNRAHALLQVGSNESIAARLGAQSLTDYLGILWVRRHPSVLAAIEDLQFLIDAEQHP